MKKIFLLTSVLLLTSCGVRPMTSDEIADNARQLRDNAAEQTHSLVERDHKHYWLNNMRTYKTYPIVCYEGSSIDTGQRTEIYSTHEFPHNTAMSANLGQRMYDSETYAASVSGKNGTYVAKENGKISSSAYHFDIKAGQTFEPVGEVKIDGKYYLLFNPHENGHILLIDENGVFVPQIARIYKNELLISENLTTVMPHELSLIPGSGNKSEYSEPQLNYTIKYNGVQNEVMSFSFIDHRQTATSGERVQKFVFPLRQNIIHINGVKFKILQATPSKVVYMILDK